MIVNQLIKRKELELFFVPNTIMQEFECMVLQSYFDEGWHDLVHVGSYVDIFATYVISLQETGNPFTYTDSEEYEEDAYFAIEDNIGLIRDDIADIFDYHHIFYASDDSGEGVYKYIDCHNMPIKEIW